MEDDFNRRLGELISTKGQNTQIFTRPAYLAMIQRVKESKSKTTCKSPKEYQLLRRYDVLDCYGGTERLIVPPKRAGDLPRYYVHTEQIFGILHDVHWAMGHAGRNRMAAEVGAKYKNITREMIVTYLNLCEICRGKQLLRQQTGSNLSSDNAPTSSSTCDAEDQQESPVDDLSPRDVSAGAVYPASESIENSSNEPPDADPQYSDTSMTAGPTISLDSIKTEVILPDDYDANDQQHSDDTAAVSTSAATPVTAAAVPSLPVTVPSLIMLNPLPKKPRIELPCDALQTTTSAITKDHHLRIPYNSSNLCVPPQSVHVTSGCGGSTSTTNSNEDRFDVFGKNVACKLRDMDKTQRILVEKIINDALFEGEMGTLTRNHKLVDMPQSHQYKTTFLAI